MVRDWKERERHGAGGAGLPTGRRLWGDSSKPSRPRTSCPRMGSRTTRPGKEVVSRGAAVSPLRGPTLWKNCSRSIEQNAPPLSLHPHTHSVPVVESRRNCHRLPLSTPNAPSSSGSGGLESRLIDKHRPDEALINMSLILFLQGLALVLEENEALKGDYNWSILGTFNQMPFKLHGL